MPEDVNPKEMALMLYKLSMETNALVRAMAMQMARMEANFFELRHGLECIANKKKIDFNSAFVVETGVQGTEAIAQLLQAHAVAAEQLYSEILKQFSKNPPSDLLSKKEDYRIDIQAALEERFNPKINT